VNEYEALVDEAVRTKHTIMLVGGLDTGKSTLSRRLVAASLEAGRTAAYLDADLGQKTVGPPATMTLRFVRSDDDLEPARLERPDALAFVGATSPQGHLLPVLAGITSLHRLALDGGADLIVVDTSGMVSGIAGQILKYHKVEILRPDLVVGLQRGEELLPLLGVIQRFFATEVVPLGVHPDVVATTVDQRAENREHAMAGYFGGELHRFRVKPTVFMPALPPMFPLEQLHRLLVGLSDGAGGTTGLGYLEHTPEEGVLRLISPVAEGPKALRLGSVRLEEGFRVKRVDLRNLFGSE
jgi:polynucleotide 5'-hydroxyl-kinase GRC3/NOL9